MKWIQLLPPFYRWETAARELQYLVQLQQVAKLGHRSAWPFRSRLENFLYRHL